MSPSGDQWAVVADWGVRLFVDGKEKVLPSPRWIPKSVGFRRDSLVVGVVPKPLGPIVEIGKLGRPPWLLGLDNDRWSTIAEHKGLSGAETAVGNLNDLIADYAAFLAGDREGKLWVARQYAYRVQRLSPGGRLFLEIAVEGGKVRKKEESKGIEIKLHGSNENPSDATRNPRSEKVTYYPFTAEPVILDLAEGRDGRIYLLVRKPEGGVALDRYDPGRAVLERVPLDLKAQGRFSIAAGKDALYLAAWDGAKGRWRISWDTLDQAVWKGVEGARIDGVAPGETEAGPEARTEKTVPRKPIRNGKE
jgi:hypothetical protein